MPDGYTSQKVECNGVYLEIKKRDKAVAGKAFSDIVVLTHYVIPSRPKDNDKGWEIQRKSGTKFEFDERRLSLSQEELEKFPKSFYFGKNRKRQLQKGFNSSISSVFDDFNWRSYILNGVGGIRNRLNCVDRSFIHYYQYTVQCLKYSIGQNGGNLPRIQEY